MTRSCQVDQDRNAHHRSQESVLGVDGLWRSRLLRYPLSSSNPSKLVSAVLALALDRAGHHGLCRTSTSPLHMDTVTDDLLCVGVLARSGVRAILYRSGIILRPRPAYAIGKEPFRDGYDYACPRNEVHSSEFDLPKIEKAINKC